jgi:hypothetical protein
VGFAHPCFLPCYFGELVGKNEESIVLYWTKFLTACRGGGYPLSYIDRVVTMASGYEPCLTRLIGTVAVRGRGKWPHHILAEEHCFSR